MEFLNWHGICKIWLCDFNICLEFLWVGYEDLKFARKLSDQALKFQNLQPNMKTKYGVVVPFDFHRGFVGGGSRLCSGNARRKSSLRWTKKRAGSSFADGFVSANGTTVLPTYRYGRIAFVSRPPRKPKQQRDARPLFRYKTEIVSNSLAFTAICNRFPQPEKRMNVCAFFLFPLWMWPTRDRQCQDRSIAHVETKKRCAQNCFSHLFSSSHMWGRHWCNL